MKAKVSEITVTDVAEYLRLEVGSEDALLQVLLDVAKSYITSYTGIENLDEVEEFTIAVFVLCQDMYDNRAMYVDSNNANKTVQTILNMHTRCNLV